MKRFLFVFLCACNGTGSVTFTTWGEEYIEQGIPRDSEALTGFVDGWSLKYSKFIVRIEEISVAKKTGEQGPVQSEAKTIDLTQPGPVDLVTFTRLEAGKWDHVSYAITSLEVAGTATQEAQTKTFAWTFAQNTLFDHCTNADFGEGVTIPNGATETVQLTVHGDHLWYDDLQSDTAKLRFQAIADADANDDGAITLEELAAVRLTRFPVGEYNTGGAGQVKTLRDFIEVLTRTIGHYRGEGECEDKSRL
jgi:hypothetical protein